jgi:CP family cyanate transporter-like MFS transporter
MFVGGLGRGLVGSADLLFIFTAVAGAGVALTVPNLPKIIASWFPSERIGVATGVYVVAFSIGPAVVFGATHTVLLPALGSWRAVLSIYGLFAFAISGLWWFTAKDRFTEIRSAKSSLRAVLRVKDVWLLGFITAADNMLWYSVSGWLPYILIERGFSEMAAGLVATVYTITSAPAMLLFPSASDHLGLRKPLIFIPLLALSPTVYLLHQAQPPTIWLLSGLFGVLVSGVFSLMFIIPVECVGLANAGGAMGLTLSLGYIGGLVGPWVVGYLRDLAGTFWPGFLTVALVNTAAALLSFLLKETGWRSSSSLAREI